MKKELYTHIEAFIWQFYVKIGSYLFEFNIKKVR